MLENIHWLGHASFKIDGMPSIVIDPWRVVKDEASPDIILISHEHYDHCSPADIDKLRGENTRIIASAAAANSLDMEGVTVLRPWQTVSFGRTSIRTVPSYTFSGDHPARRQNLGFVISTNYYDIYYAGDTDFVPELRSLRCDIAILPISGKDGLMNPQAAAELVTSARPSAVLPSHLGSGMEGGGQVELHAFYRALEGLTTIVKPGTRDLLFARR